MKSVSPRPTERSFHGKALLLQSATPCAFLPVGLEQIDFDTMVIPAKQFSGDEDLRGVQVIVYAPDEKSHLNESAQRRVKNFVYSGGGLVVFEWITYHVDRKKMSSWSEFIPIIRNGNGIAGTLEFSVVDRSHPITKGLPTKFAVFGGFSVPATAHKGHVLVTCGSDDFPAVVVHRYGRGKIVHINNAPAFRGVNSFTYTSMQTLFMNSVLFASTAHPHEETPMLNYDDSKMWCDALLLSNNGVKRPIHLALLSCRCPELCKAVMSSTETSHLTPTTSSAVPHPTPMAPSDSSRPIGSDFLDEEASDTVSEAEKEHTEHHSLPVRSLTLPCTGDGLEFLVSYLYTERMEASGDYLEKEKLGVDLADLIPIAVKYNMPHLHYSLIKLISDLWNLKTITKVSRRLSQPEYCFLKKPAFEYILRSYKHFIVDRDSLDKIDKETLIDIMQCHFDPRFLELLPVLPTPKPSLVTDMETLFMRTQSKDPSTTATGHLCDFTIRFDMSRAPTSGTPSASSSPMASPRSGSVQTPRTLIKSPSMPSLRQHVEKDEVASSSDGEASPRMGKSISFHNLHSMDCVEVYAHKFVLASRSRFFEALFRSHMRDSESVMVITPEPGNAAQPTPTAFRSFLQYLYCNQIAISPQDAIYFLDATEYYGLQDDSFERACRQIFSHGLSADNVLQTYARAYSVQNDFVKETALEYIAANFQTISVQPYLQELDKDLLLEILHAVASRHVPAPTNITAASQANQPAKVNLEGSQDAAYHAQGQDL